MNRAVAYWPNGHYDFKEIGYGRDETVWYDVFEFEDGTTKKVNSHDPDRERWFEEIENYNEQKASDYYEAGRDFTGNYEP